MTKIFYIVLICMLYLSCNVNQELKIKSSSEVYIESTNDKEMCVMPIYESQSKQLSHMLDIFKDSCLNLYGCDGLEWAVVNFMYLNDYTTKSHVKLSRIYYSSNLRHGLTRFKSEGFVVTRIDSINILIQKNDLYSSNYFNDVEFIGEQKKYLKYNQFQECMKIDEVLLLLNFNYSPGIDSVYVY